MNKLFLMGAGVLLIAFAACGQSGSNKSEGDSVSAAPAVVVESDGPSALVANGLPTIVDFSAEWCPPCRQLKPIFHGLKEEYAGKVDFVTVNVDSVPELANQYKIQSIPALIYLDATGKEVYRSVGFQPADAIKADITTYFKK